MHMQKLDVLRPTAHPLVWYAIVRSQNTPLSSTTHDRRICKCTVENNKWKTNTRYLLIAPRKWKRSILEIRCDCPAEGLNYVRWTTRPVFCFPWTDAVVDTWMRNSLFLNNITKFARSPGARCEHTRGRPRQVRWGRANWRMKRIYRTVRWTCSSRAIKISTFITQNVVLKRSWLAHSWPLHHCTYLYILYISILLGT